MSLVACFTFLKLPFYVTFYFLMHSFFKEKTVFYTNIEADIFIISHFYINPWLSMILERT